MMMSDDICGIYMIKHKDTGQMYIGQSKHIYKRWKHHCYGHDKFISRIDRAINKYGEDNFTLQVIEELSNDSDCLKEREKYWIKKYNTFEDKNHYNLTPGGDYCLTQDPSQLYKFQGENHWDCSGDKNPMYGKNHTEESKRKMSLTVSANVNTTGFYRVTKCIDKSCKQGFTWFYMYNDNGRKRAIRSVYLKKLEEKVKQQGLEWKILSKEKAEQSLLSEKNDEISSFYNTSGYYHVYKRSCPKCNQGFTWVYYYTDENGKEKNFSSVDIDKLEHKVKNKGYKWIKYNKDGD